MSSTRTLPQRKAGTAHGWKALDDAGTFEAIVAVFGNIDLGNDRIVAGAFANSLDRWAASGDPIPVIFSHRWDELDAHVGTVLEAAELHPGDARLPAAIADLGGLYVKARIELDEDFAGRLWKRLRNRSIREFSFAYDVVKARPGTDGALDLLELELIEVGPTLKGMNPLTELVGAKNRTANDALAILERADELEAGLTIKTVTETTPAHLAAPAEENDEDEEVLDDDVLDDEEDDDVLDDDAKAAESATTGDETATVPNVVKAEESTNAEEPNNVTRILIEAEAGIVGLDL